MPSASGSPAQPPPRRCTAPATSTPPTASRSRSRPSTNITDCVTPNRIASVSGGRPPPEPVAAAATACMPNVSAP